MTAPYNTLTSHHGNADFFAPVATAGEAGQLSCQHFYSPPITKHLLFLNEQVARLQAKYDATHSHEDRFRLKGAVHALMIAQSEVRHG